MNYSVCKFCEDNDEYYGCMNQDCQVYQDIKADSIYQDYLDDKREEALIEQNY